MKCFFRAFLFCAPFFVLAACAHPVKVITSRAWMQSEIAATVGSMTLAEKSSQVLMTGIDGKDAFPGYLNAHFRDVVPGAVLLFRYNITDSPEGVHAYLDSCDRSFSVLDPKNSVLFVIDHEGGDVFRTSGITSRLPSARFVADRYSVTEAEKLYRLSGIQLASLGIRMNLAPVAERETGFNSAFLGTRAYSDREDTVVSFAGAAVRGYRTAGVLSVLKHFPGNGIGDPHTGLPRLDVSRQQLLDHYADTFKSLLSEAPDAVLVSHIVIHSIDSVPFCLSHEGVTGLLRRSLGFTGVIMTDDISMGALARNGYSSRDAAVGALKAGCDMIMTSDRDIRSIAGAIEHTAVSDAAFSERLDDAVVRILTMKARAGLVKTALERYSISRYGAARTGTGSRFPADQFYGARKNAGLLLEEMHGK